MPTLAEQLLDSREIANDEQPPQRPNRRYAAKHRRGDKKPEASR